MASKLKVVSPDMVHDFVQIAQGAHGKPHPFSRLLVRAPTANLPAQGWRTLPVLLDAQAVAPAQGRSFSSPALERLELSRSGLERLGEKLGLGVVLDANASRFHSGEKILQLTPGGAEAAVFLSVHFPDELQSAAPLVRRLLAEEAPTPSRTERFLNRDAAFALLFARLCQEGVSGLFYDLRLNSQSIRQIEGIDLALRSVQQELYDQQARMLHLLYSGKPDTA